MFHTWISCKRKGSPSQSPTRQPLLSTVISTRKTNRKLTKSQTHPQESLEKELELSYTMHQRPQWTVETHHSKIQSCRVFFKGTTPTRSLLMHPKDPVPDDQKTDIIYHWKCPANNCTAEYIGETNTSLKERVSEHRNQTTIAIRNHNIATKHPRVELKDFTIIDRERERVIPYTVKQKKHFTFVSKIHHSTETLTKSELLQYSRDFSDPPHN